MPFFLGGGLLLACSVARMLSCLISLRSRKGWRAADLAVVSTRAAAAGLLLLGTGTSVLLRHGVVQQRLGIDQERGLLGGHDHGVLSALDHWLLAFVTLSMGVFLIVEIVAPPSTPDGRAMHQRVTAWVIAIAGLLLVSAALSYSAQLEPAFGHHFFGDHRSLPGVPPAQHFWASRWLGMFVLGGGWLFVLVQVRTATSPEPTRGQMWFVLAATSAAVFAFAASRGVAADARSLARPGRRAWASNFPTMTEPPSECIAFSPTGYTLEFSNHEVRTNWAYLSPPSTLAESLRRFRRTWSILHPQEPLPLLSVFSEGSRPYGQIRPYLEEGFQLGYAGALVHYQWMEVLRTRTFGELDIENSCVLELPAATLQGIADGATWAEAVAQARRSHRR